MPNKDTFSIKPIHELVAGLIVGMAQVVDPFCGYSPFKHLCTTNDLNPEILADSHVDALEFLQGFASGCVDMVLFDPPYSPRQVSECYRALDHAVNMQTTQASFWSKLKKEISRIVRPAGLVVTCGWNSGGIGKAYDFKAIEVLLVPHGGWHNDTIVTVERRSA